MDSRPSYTFIEEYRMKICARYSTFNGALGLHMWLHNQEPRPLLDGENVLFTISVNGDMTNIDGMWQELESKIKDEARSCRIKIPPHLLPSGGKKDFGSS